MVEPPRDKELAKLFASKFIARPDVYAVQKDDIWMPVREKIGMQQLLDHINGRASYGHYLLNENNQCKFFAFDIDLEEAKPNKNIYYPMPGMGTGTDWRPETFTPGDPRGKWTSGQMFKIQREFLTHQLLSMAHKLAVCIWQQFDLPVAITYSGNKGMHVYGFTGLIDATEARDGAEIILETLGCFEAYKGNNFYRHKQSEVPDPVDEYPQLSIEVFPKQTELSNDKQLGNLMRLPTGRNLKGGEAFFVDMRDTRRLEIPRRDPIEALTVENPWVGYL